jgi:hypothetical protein
MKQKPRNQRRVSVSIDPEIHEKLVEASETERRTIAEIVRFALVNHLEDAGYMKPAKGRRAA